MNTRSNASGKRDVVYINSASMAAPSDSAAEEELVCAGLALAEVVDEVEPFVSASDFSDDTRRRIWRAMAALRAKGQPVDTVTVGRMLQESDELLAIGGPSALVAYAGRVFDPSLELCRSYAQSIRGKAKRRRVLEALQIAVGEGYQGRGSDAEWVASVESAVFAATQDERTISPDGSSLWELVALEERRVQAIDDGEQSGTIIPTGFRALDRLVGGIGDGEAIVIAGRPSMGKTALLAQIGKQRAEYTDDGVKHGVLFFELEMKAARVLHRLIAARANVPLGVVISPKNATVEQRHAMADARAYLSTLPMVIDDTPVVTPARVRSRLMRAMRKFNKPGQRISLCVVDYLQRMRPDRFFGTSSAERSREVGETMLACVELGKEHGVAMVFGSQLNRDVGKRSGAELRPRMTDIAESGAVEMHANGIWAIHRPEFYYPGKTDVPNELRGKAEIIALKARDAEPGLATLDYVGECTRFQNEAGTYGR